MCGIFGIIAKPSSSYSPGKLKRVFYNLAVLSESRGKESFGFAVKDFNKMEIVIIKGAMPVSRALKEKAVSSYFEQVFDESTYINMPLVAIGHSRLVTNGSQTEQGNNQPVIKNDMAVVHNGIIVNADSLWKENTTLIRRYSTDTEIIPSIIRMNIDLGMNPAEAILEMFSRIKGTASLALIFSDLIPLYLGTNCGSLYILTINSGLLLFASERYILKNACLSNRILDKTNENRIEQVSASSGFWVNPLDNEDLISPESSVLINSRYEITNNPEKFLIKSIAIEETGSENSSLVDIKKISANINAQRERSLLEYNAEKINSLKRCTKCVLPETFPFIEFDDKGECNYCRNYIKRNWSSNPASFLNLIDQYRSINGKQDCIIPCSGGRDSSFLLHYAKKEMGLNPIAFTYDWGMVTDLARRNIARLCGKLGIENIIVSADIKWKRENIRKNISAWLKDPQLGMIPLFMAGDKYFFYYTNKLKKQTGIKLNIWGINPLENTEFKVGFAGISPRFNKRRIYSLDYVSQLKLLSYTASQYLKNPSYVNQSIADTFGSYLVRFFYPQKDYYPFYDYFKWDEKTIEDMLLNEYEWEKAADTSSTWRIGDGTSGFYNYIYYTITGFSENDTFRSNQIREGMISRDRAIIYSQEENRPRYESIKWYLEAVGLDFETVIKKINSIQKLY